MTLFSKKIKQVDKDVKFVGAHVPLPLNSYLTMYVLVNETSKSALIISMMNDWIHNTDLPVSDLILALKKKVLATYRTHSEKKHFVKVRFIEKLRKELSNKGIDEDIIWEILNYVKNETK